MMTEIENCMKVAALKNEEVDKFIKKCKPLPFKSIWMPCEAGKENAIWWAKVHTLIFLVITFLALIFDNVALNVLAGSWGFVLLVSASYANSKL